MTQSRLVNRNVLSARGRTSMRLEPELWDALYEICAHEKIGVGDLIRRIEAQGHSGGRTSAVRVFVLQYYRAAAMDAGHSQAGHGASQPEDPDVEGGSPEGQSAGSYSRPPPIGAGLR